MALVYPYGLFGELALFAAIVEKAAPALELVGAAKIVEIISVSVTKTIWVVKVVDVITVPGELQAEVDTGTREELVAAMEGPKEGLEGIRGEVAELFGIPSVLAIG